MGHSSRRSFLKKLGATAAALGLSPWTLESMLQAQTNSSTRPARPVSGQAKMMLSTWNHGMECNAAGFLALQQGGKRHGHDGGWRPDCGGGRTGLSVGIGGCPTATATSPSTRAAWTTRATQALSALCNLAHPLLARKVMEDTPHVMLAGAGAEQYARELGMDTCDLLTEQSRQAWDGMAQDVNYAPVINIENHDTIGILAMDDEGTMAGGCTTSGLAYKMHGARRRQPHPRRRAVCGPGSRRRHRHGTG